MIKTKKEKNKDMNKGITLIALVITIIVLLILAGVSIATLTGENGILTRANDAKTSTEIAEEKEKVRLAAGAAYAEDLGGEIKEDILRQELERYFGADGVDVTAGTNNGEDGFIVTIDDSGRQYFVDKDGNVSEMVQGPTVTHSINPETQVGDGEKITITITATATEGEITKITLPDGTTVSNVTETTYEVEENGDYVFIVEQSNGGITKHIVPITNGKDVEKFSDIYGNTTEYKENGETVAWIPKGFAVGVSSTIDEVSEGLVITDAIDSNHKSTGNEFVWVPVKEINDMAQCSTAGGSCNVGIDEEDGVFKCTTHNSTDLVGKLYATSTGNNFTGDTPNTTYNANSGLREPAVVTGSSSGTGSYYDNNAESYLSIINEKLGTSYSSSSEFLADMKVDFYNMAKSVEKYGGFYIGRYEISKSDSDTAQSKRNSIALIADDDNTEEKMNGNKWYGLYAYGKTYTNSANSVTSSMVWGSQYDAMMRWMENNGENVKSTTVPNDGSKNTNSTITGPEGDSDIIRNVYDLYGGRFEWTLEAYDIFYRVLRGRLL